MASVIVPVYNAAPFIGSCLESVLAQTLREFEVICVDDGSTDGSRQIVQGFADLDPRVRLICQEHRFQGAARNRGIRAARGEFICFLDADDELEPMALEACCAACREHDLDVATYETTPFVEDEAGVRKQVLIPDVRPRGELEVGGRVLSGPELWDETYKSTGLPFACWLYCLRASFAKGSRLFFEEGIYFEDNDWVLRLYLAAKRIAYLPQRLHRYRYRPGSTVHSGFTPELLQSCFVVHDALLRISDGCGNRAERGMAFDMTAINCRRFDWLADLGNPVLMRPLVKGFLRELDERLAADDEPALHQLTHIVTARRILNAVSGWEGDPLADERALISRHLPHELDMLLDPDARVALYGIGLLAEQIVDMVEGAGHELPTRLFFVDRRAAQVPVFHGRPVVAPEELHPGSADAVLLTSTKFAGQMAAVVRERMGDVPMRRVSDRLNMLTWSQEDDRGVVFRKEGSARG